MATIGVAATVGGVGPSATPDVGQGSAFMALQSPWGPDGVWLMVASMGDFIRKYGGLNKQVSVGSPDVWSIETTDAVVQGYYAAKTYFAEKQQGSPGVLYVSRVCASSSGPVAASGTFSDGAAHNTTVTAKGKGAWGNTVTVTITNPSPISSSKCRIVIAFPLIGYSRTYDIGCAADATAASDQDEFVTITLPAGEQLPSTAAATKLTSGSQGTTAYSASDADYVGTDSGSTKTGLQVFNDMRLGTGYVCIPGKYSSTVRTGINTHCASYDRIGLLSAPSGKTSSNVAADISGTAGNQLAYYWPQLKVSDENSDSGGLLTIDNTGAVAGLAARMIRDYQFGPHKSPAGITHNLVSVVNLELSSTGLELADDAVSNTLADSFVNTIRRKGNPVGLVVWGNRMLATDKRYLQFNASQTINLVKITGKLILEKFTFEPVDPQGMLFGKIRADFNVFLLSLFRKGALFGTEPGNESRATDAFLCVCDRSNNPDSVLVGNEVHVDVTFAPTPNAEKITLQLGPAAPGYAGKAAQ